MVKRLKELRLQRKLRQEDLGNLFGATKSAVSMWESGKREPDKETFLALAEYFGVTVDYLMGRDDPKSEQPAPVDELRQEGLTLMSELQDSELEKAIEYAKFLISQRK